MREHIGTDRGDIAANIRLRQGKAKTDQPSIPSAIGMGKKSPPPKEGAGESFDFTTQLLAKV